MRAQPNKKGGGLRCGHNQKRGDFMKKRVLGTEVAQRGGGLGSLFIYCLHSYLST